MKKAMPLDIRTGGSELALTSVNATPPVYVDGKRVDGVTGDPKIEFVILDTFEQQGATVKALAPELTSITPEQIEESLETRKYIMLEFTNGTAKPYVKTEIGGRSKILYSVKADSVRIKKAAPSPSPAPRSTK